MRVLHVCQPIGYGVTMAVGSLAVNQLSLGHEVTVLGPAIPLAAAMAGRRPRSRQLVGAGVALPGGGRPIAAGWPDGLLRPEPRIVDWTRAQPLDSRLALDVALVRSAVRPDFGGRLPFDVVHLHSSRAGLVGRVVDLGVPVVFQPHGWSFQALTGLRRRAAVVLERQLARRARGHVYCSTMELGAGLSAGIDPGRRMVALNAPSVETVVLAERDPEAARRSLGLPEQGPVYAFVGRLVAQKAPERLWRAWSEVRRRQADATLLVMGQGPVPRMDGVLALGFVDDVARHLDASDALVLLSRWEGLPLAILDAMARGVPVVASRESIDPEDLGRAGIVVDGDDPRAVADALLARRGGSALGALEAAAGVSMVADRYDPRQLAARVCSFYDQVVGG